MKNLKTTFFLGILLVLLVIGNTSNYVSGSSIEVGIDDIEVKVMIESKLYQNMTKFPETDTDISGSELNMAKSAFEDALKIQTEKPLKISSLSIYVKSNDSWLNVSAIFDLDGVSSSENEVISTDLSWIPFKVVSDLKVGNLSYNLVGEEYLRPAIYELANQSDLDHEVANQSNVNFFSPFYTPITTSMAMNIAGNVSTFDLGQVSTNFTSWNKFFDENSFTTSWNLPTRTILDLRAQITSENASDVRTGTAFYGYADAYATVSIPGHGVIVDHSVICEDSSSRYSIIMLTVIIVLIALVIVSRYFGKRLMKTKRASN
ncbi:MAG: hypothetical protein NWE90_08165 [Candidatus Bathyarchaeota archaeon]|nr:hypothetical protein [Candidatus Bathyarchaeota archaeon]